MSRRLITFVCAIFALTYAVAFVTKARGPDGMVVDQFGRPQLTDYLSLWTAGKLATEGRVVAAYDWNAHAAAMGDVMQRPAKNPLQFSYPPTFLLVLSPLSDVSFAVSFVLFGLLTLIPFAFVAMRIVGRSEAALWILATVPPFWNFMVGQTGALAATLLAGGLLVLPARPILAGVLFGLLTFKPHLGLLVPVALLAARRYSTFAVAAVTGLAIGLISVAFYGIEPWLAFADSLSRFSAFALADTNATAYKFQSLFGLLRTIGVSAQLALAMQALLALAVVALVWRTWRSPGAHDLKSGLLLTGAVLVSPYTYHYDLTMLSLAQAFLLRHALSSTLSADEIPKTALLVIAAVNALIMLFPPLSVPTGFLASLVLAGTFLYRLAGEQPGLLPAMALPASIVPRIGGATR